VLYHIKEGTTAYPTKYEWSDLTTRKDHTRFLNDMGATFCLKRKEKLKKHLTKKIKNKK
jgi:hypothetical protein